MIKVLFVCMGNICRSPMAESVFRHMVAQAGLADQFEIDSAGTHDYHIGSPPHPGTQRVLRARNIEVGDHRAREVTPRDLREFDYVVAMDSDNLANLRSLAPKGVSIYRLLDFAPEQPLRDVPDPYYMGNYENTYELVSAGARGLLTHIEQERHLNPQTQL